MKHFKISFNTRVTWKKIERHERETVVLPDDQEYFRVVVVKVLLFDIMSVLNRIFKNHYLCGSISSVVKNTRLSSAQTATESTSSPLIITQTCAERIRSVAEPEEFLRIEVEGGGCSGFQYKFHLDKNVQPDDKVFERDGSKVVVDETSLELIRGSTVDFREELIRNSFCITSNPQAEKGCSCGSSFALRLD